MTLPTGKSNTRASRRAAFTLVELLLVMSLLVIVMAIAAPTLGNFFRGRTLHSEARRLLALTRYGQGRAISEGVPMLLWVDEKERAYGLEEESGYTDLDSKAVEYSLDKDLEIELRNDLFPRTPAWSPFGARMTRPVDRIPPSMALSRSIHRNLPAVRFQPDGSLSETSPQAFCLRDKQGDEIWLQQSTNRLTYEFRQEPNWIAR